MCRILGLSTVSQSGRSLSRSAIQITVLKRGFLSGPVGRLLAEWDAIRARVKSICSAADRASALFTSREAKSTIKAAGGPFDWTKPSKTPDSHSRPMPDVGSDARPMFASTVSMSPELWGRRNRTRLSA